MKTVTIKTNDPIAAKQAAKRLTELSGVLAVFNNGDTLEISCGERLSQSTLCGVVNRCSGAEIQSITERLM